MPEVTQEATDKNKNEIVVDLYDRDGHRISNDSAK